VLLHATASAKETISIEDELEGEVHDPIDVPDASWFVTAVSVEPSAAATPSGRLGAVSVAGVTLGRAIATHQLL